MLRGLYISATGMGAQELEHNRVANNLANANTSGFKKENYVLKTFQDVLLSRVERHSEGNKVGREIGSINYGVTVDAREIDFSDGILQETEKNTDLALLGKAMFTIETDEGLFFTRDGSFKVDDNGNLVTNSGGYVLGYGGLINIGDMDFTITQDGEIVSEDGWIIDQLLLADFEDWQRLEKAGDNLFYAPEDLYIEPAMNFDLRQGFLEKPNLNLVKEIVDLIAISRVYEANQKAIQAQDEILGKSVNELGTVR